MRVGSGRRRRVPARTVRVCSLEEERLRIECLSSTEEAAYAAGFRFVAGVDEVGRGCLAGPVYAGAAVLARGVTLWGLDDSKVLFEDVREAVARRVLETAVGIGLGAATAAEIDSLGIVEASFLAMRRALAALAAAGILPDLVLVDAFRLPGCAPPQRAYLHGDARVAAIAAAAVVAKCARDRFMEELDREYPHYGFASHRGYATAEHIDALLRHGPCPVHRLTFDRVVPATRGLSPPPLLRETAEKRLNA
jgi:ribonuclease HII